MGFGRILAFEPGRVRKNMLVDEDEDHGECIVTCCHVAPHSLRNNHRYPIGHLIVPVHTHKVFGVSLRETPMWGGRTAALQRPCARRFAASYPEATLPKKIKDPRSKRPGPSFDLSSRYSVDH